MPQHTSAYHSRPQQTTPDQHWIWDSGYLWALYRPRAPQSAPRAILLSGGCRSATGDDACTWPVHRHYPALLAQRGLHEHHAALHADMICNKEKGLSADCGHGHHATRANVPLFNAALTVSLDPSHGSLRPMRVSRPLPSAAVAVVVVASSTSSALFRYASARSTLFITCVNETRRTRTPAEGTQR